MEGMYVQTLESEAKAMRGLFAVLELKLRRGRKRYVNSPVHTRVIQRIQGSNLKCQYRRRTAILYWSILFFVAMKVMTIEQISESLFPISFSSSSFRSESNSPQICVRKE